MSDDPPCTPDDIAARILRITEEELRSKSESLLLDRTRMLLDLEFHGVAMSAPERVDLKMHHALPLVIGMRSDGARAYRVRRNPNTMLAAMELDTDRVYFASAFVDKARRRRNPRLDGRAAREPIDDDDAQSICADVQIVDAREILDIPWSSGRYRLAVIVLEWISNFVDMEVRGSGPPSGAMTRDVYPRPPIELSVDVPILRPTYLGDGTAPEENEGASVRFALAPDVRGALMLSGSFIVVAEHRHLAPADLSLQEIDGREHHVRAVVPIAFALVGLDWTLPVTFELRIPVYGSAPAVEGRPLMGHFALDVGTVTGIELPPGSHCAYAFLVGRAFGPVVFTLGDRTSERASE